MGGLIFPRNPNDHPLHRPSLNRPVKPDDMALPTGKTCGDCEWLERKCSWLIGAKVIWTTCDFSPSRFFQKAEKKELRVGETKEP